MVHTLWGIHTYKKDRSTQVIKCSPWGTKVQPFPSLKKKMVEFMMHRQIITTPFANMFFQQRPKVAARKCSLVPLTRLNRANLLQLRKVNVGPLPEATELGSYSWKSQGCGRCHNQPDPNTDQPTDEHTIQTVSYLTQTSYKVYQTL